MIEINNLTRIKIDDEFLKEVAKIVLKGENKETENLSIVLVDKKTIRELNKKYRKKNEATDVLSFNYNSKLGGEIAICPQMVKNDNLVAVLIHGILHILGYDHEKSKKEAAKMEEKERYYLKKI